MPHTAKNGEGKRPPYDMLVLLAVIIYGYMEGVYSSRDLANARGQNINFMWLLRGNPPPSHGMINAFRKHIPGAAIEALLYEVVGFLGDCGEVGLPGCL
jgi:transposase